MSPLIWLVPLLAAKAAIVAAYLRAEWRARK